MGLKERVVSMIEGAEQEISIITKTIENTEANAMYSGEYKLKVKKELQEKGISIKKKLAEDIKTVFKEKIEKIENTNIYVDDNPASTANIIKMIEISKENIYEKELNYLNKMYKDNNIIKRILLSIAREKNLYMEDIFIPDASEYEDLRDSLIKSFMSNNSLSVYGMSTTILLNSMQI